MTKSEPYFMSNQDWFYFDEKDFCYKLTKEAPEKARKSYQEYYDALNSIEKGEDV